MRLVIIESPFAGDIDSNIEYARKAVAHSLSEGEAPIASHLLYTQPGILNDNLPTERALGIAAGLAWIEVAEATVVYLDRGLSKGMRHGIAEAYKQGLDVQVRFIENNFTREKSMELIDEVAHICSGPKKERKKYYDS